MRQNKLHNIKKTGLNIPDNYFECLEDQIMSQVKLSELGSAGFKMPDNYLDAIENRVIDTIAQEKAPKVISLFSKQNIIYISSVAAAIIILLNLSIFEKDAWDIEAQTVENYIINEDISSYEIASLLDDEDLIEENFVIHNFSDETIENYVLDNVDIEKLILE